MASPASGLGKRDAAVNGVNGYHHESESDGSEETTKTPSVQLFDNKVSNGSHASGLSESASGQSGKGKDVENIGNYGYSRTMPPPKQSKTNGGIQAGNSDAQGAGELSQGHINRRGSKRSSEDDGGESPTKRFRSESKPTTFKQEEDASLKDKNKILEAALRGMHSTWNNFVSSYLNLDFAYHHPQMTQDMLTTSYHFHYLCSGAHRGVDYSPQTMDPSAVGSAQQTNLPIRQREDTIMFHSTVNGVQKEHVYKLDPNNENVAVAQHTADITPADDSFPYIQLTDEDKARKCRDIPTYIPGL